MMNRESIADRIKAIRVRLGLSQAAMAKRMGMHPSQLCKIELGHNGLSGASLRRVADALGVTIAEVLGESAGVVVRREEIPVAFAHGDGALRVLADELSREMVEKVARAAKEFEKMLAVAARGSLPQTSLPLVYPYGVDEDVAELLARDMRHALGIGCAPIVDLVAVLEMYGVRIVRVPLAKRFQSGSFYHPAARALTIVLNASNTPQRNGYRLAYELGAAAAFATSGFRTIRDEGPVHRFLRRFTAAFLMPEEAMRKDVAQSGIAPDRWTFRLLVMMKSHFAVSAEAYALRLESLGLIDPGLRVRLRDRLRAHYQKHPKAMEPHAKDSSHLAIRLELSKGGGK